MTVMDNHPYLTGAADFGHGHDHESASGHDHLLAEFESPFTLTAPPAEPSAAATESLAERESPFRATATTAATDEDNPAGELFAQFLDEFADDEFDEAVVDLSNELERFAADHQLSAHLEGETGGPGQEELLLQHLRPLTVATDRYLADLSREMARHDEEATTPEQLDELFERFAAQHELGNPVFEHFFKKLRKKVRKIAGAFRKGIRKVKSVVKKFSPVHLILGRLRKMAAKLFHRIVGRVIGKLPPVLRGPAEKLAQRLGLRRRSGSAPQGRRRTRNEFYDGELYDDELYDDELYDDEFYDDELYDDELVLAELYDDEFTGDEMSEFRNTAALPAAAPEPELIQREFDLLLTGQLLAPNEGMANELLDAYLTEGPDHSVVEGEVLAARERLVTAITTASSEDEVRPHVEEFVGVILKAVKVGIRLIGRDRVIKFIAGIFTKLIARLIGKESAAPLARAIVTKGFDLLDLEAPAAGNEARVAGEAVAQVLEELTLHVATLSNEVVDNAELLEQEVYEQFTQLVAGNFPTTLVQEELRESQVAAAWTLLPARGRKRYKKYGLIQQVKLRYDQLRGLKTFGGQYLVSFLNRRHGYRRGEELHVKVHVFEAVRGTTLSHISLLEKRTPGLGSARRSAWSQIHPLTPQVAGQLLGNPALGRHMDSRWLRSRHRIQVKQRFYYLEVVGRGAPKRIPTVPTPGAHPPVRRDEAQVKLDFTRSTVTLALLMTEGKAAEMTRRLRANDYYGAAATFRTAIRDALNNVLLRHAGRQVKIVMEAQEEQYLEGFLGKLFRRAKSAAGGVLVAQVKRLVAKLLQKLVQQAEKALIAHLKRLRADFIRAQEDGAQGVSIHLVFLDMPGMGLLGAALRIARGKPVRVGDVARAVLPAVPMPDARLFPGRKSVL